jgi:2-methylcitrate dehydratase PrpD
VVRVATNEAKIVNNREIPDICLQHLCAVMLLDKTVTFKSAHEETRMTDPAVLRQRAKVQLVPDQALEDFMPRRAAIVEVTLTDGKTISERVNDVRGTSENPMSREEIIAKARDLITPVLGAATFGKLSDRIFDLEHLKSVRELRPLLQRG